LKAAFAEHERAGNGRVPKVLGLAEVLREWLDHRRDVLIRRSRYRQQQIEHRLEVLGGYLIAYLNLDEVIRIIRTEDEPKPVLIKTFKLTEVQADAILNMRLRSLRKLEEMEIRNEDKTLRNELKGLKAVLASEEEQWKRSRMKSARCARPSGRRRRSASAAPVRRCAGARSRCNRGGVVEREPITVVVSSKGWVRTLKGHVADLSGPHLQDRRQARLRVLRGDTSKLLLFAYKWKVLHARRIETAGRAWPWRADPPVHRSRAGRRHRHAVPEQGRAQVPGREPGRAGLRRQRGRLRRQHAQGQAGAERRAPNEARGHRW
jgi:DNA gyrase/topoisomerase IV subunit A